MSRVLVIDDEPNIVFSFRECLESSTLQIISAGTSREGLELARQRRPDVVLLDLRLPDGSGLDAFDHLRELDPRLPVVMITAYARTETAIEAMRRGAFDYLVKPVDLSRLKHVIAKAVEVSRLSRVPAVFDADDADDQADRIVGTSPAMQEVYKSIGRIAPQTAPVLILGESGTGKELVARAIYHYSDRHEQPFLAINCAALPETLLESELFGHERGAFTGADQRRIGKFEQVHGGTIFLDEIGDMSPATQAKALRLLQEQRFERLGGNATVHTDVRIIAATNQDLAQRVAEGRFRQDLLYRLNGFTIRLPALRERKEDIPLLLDHFVRRFGRDLGKKVNTITTEVRELLASRDWPGNVREFQSVVRYAMVQAIGPVIVRDCLPRDFIEASVSAAGVADGPQVNRYAALETRIRGLLQEGRGEIYQQIIGEVDRLLLDLVLEHTRGNQVQAAEALGISRMTLRSKMRAFGLLAEKAGD